MTTEVTYKKLAEDGMPDILKCACGCGEGIRNITTAVQRMGRTITYYRPECAERLGIKEGEE